MVRQLRSPGAGVAAVVVAAAGIGVCSGGLPAGAALLGASAAVLGAASALASGRRAPLWIAAAALGLARAQEPPAAPPAPARAVRFEARLATCQAYLDGTAAGELDRLRRPDGEALDHPGRRISFRSPQGAPPAGRLSCSGLLTAEGGRLRLEAMVWTPAPGAGPGPLERLRQGIRRQLESRLGPEESAMAIALLLGDRRAIPEERYGPYRSLGLLHLLAVSGMHLWLWDAMLRRVLPGRLQLLRLPLLGVAALLAGGRPPVVRALAVLSLRELARIRAWRVTSLSLWACALWSELALLPPRPADLGLVLSYSATGALILGSGGGRPGSPLAALRASSAAFLGTAPWLHQVQGTLEPWSVPLTPVLALILPIRLSLALLAALPGVGDLAVWPLETLGSWEGRLLERLDRLPATPWATPRCSSALLGALCASLLGGLAARGAGRKRALAAAAGLAGVLLLFQAAGPSRPGILALPVGHGLGVVIAGHQGAAVFDLGSAEHGPRRLVDRILLPALRAQRWPLPAFHLASHRDLDHVSGLGRLRRELGSLDLAAAPDRSRRVPGIEPWTATAWGSRPVEPADSNGRGQVLDVQGPAGRAVLIGDQDGWSLRRLLRHLPPGPVDLLLLPHHGLSTDGVAELLDHLRPRLAWISCGSGDLPLPVAPMLDRRGIPWRTTLDGALRFPELR